jgi:ABC-type multidrug transport system fused ATPase/permease subunit
MLQQGEVAASGRHDELLAKDAAFQAMAASATD